MNEETVNNRGTIIIVGIIIIILALFVYTLMRTNSSNTQAPKENEIEIKLGSDDAKNSMVIYLDPLCDRCHQFSEEVISELEAEEVTDGKLKISLRPLSIFSGYSASINELTLCAHNQGKYLQASSVIGSKLHSQGDEAEIDQKAKAFLSENPIKFVADKLDINESELSDCVNDGTISARLTDQDDIASKNGIYSIPTIYINSNEPINGYAQLGYIRSQLEL